MKFSILWFQAYIGYLEKNHTIHTVFFWVRERERKNFFEKKFLPGASNFFVAILFLIKGFMFYGYSTNTRSCALSGLMKIFFSINNFLRIFSIPEKVPEHGERDRPLHIPVKNFQQLYKSHLFKINKLTIKGMYLNFFF